MSNLLAIPYIKLDSLLPLGEAGFATILKSTIVPSAYFGELFLLSMMLPYARSPRAAFIAGNAASILLAFFLTLLVTTMVTVLGVETTTRSIYALFFLNDFVPPIGMKVFLLSLWVVAFWGKIMLLQFITTSGISQLLELKSYNYIVIPVAALSLVLSFSFYINIPDMLTTIPLIFPGIALFFEYLIPTLLLVIALIKAKVSNKSDTASNTASNPAAQSAS